MELEVTSEEKLDGSGDEGSELAWNTSEELGLELAIKEKLDVVIEDDSKDEEELDSEE